MVYSAKILAVDDEPELTELMHFHLVRAGHEVATAANGWEAIASVRHSRPDIILLDIGLPELSGYSVAQELRRNSELARTLLIAMTGYGRLEDREKSLAAGFDEHLVKPINYEKLRELLIN